MSVVLEPSLAQLFRQWRGAYDKNGPSFGRIQQPLLQDNDTCIQLRDALDRYFPLAVRDGAGSVRNINACIFDGQSNGSGSWNQSDIEGFAKAGQTGLWILISAFSVDRLRWISLMLLGNKEFRQFAKLDEMPESFIWIGSELIVQAGLEFLIFHELGHFMSGNYAVKRGLYPTKGTKALELEADLFALDRFAESCISSRLQIMPSRAEWRNLSDHFFSALALMGVFSVFALMAAGKEDRTVGSEYPEFWVRIQAFCNEFCIGMEDRTSGKQEGFMKALGLLRFASVGFPMVLRELKLDSPKNLAALTPYAPLKGTYLTLTPEIQSWFEATGNAMGPYVQELNVLRNDYGHLRNRRTKREIWDSNW